jgi:hypothetical protein
MMMKLSIFALFGIIAPIIFVITVVVGGLMTPGYSHLSQSISELVMSGAPNKLHLDISFSINYVFSCIFGFGLFVIFRSKASPLNSSKGLVGFIILGVIAVLSFLSSNFFTMNLPGTPATTSGTVHLLLVGLESIGSMAAILLVGLWFKKVGLRGYGVYSIITLVIVFATGIMTLVGTTQDSSYVGLFERLTIGAFALWSFIIALKFHNFRPGLQA